MTKSHSFRSFVNGNGYQGATCLTMNNQCLIQEGSHHFSVLMYYVVEIIMENVNVGGIMETKPSLLILNEMKTLTDHMGNFLIS